MMQFKAFKPQALNKIAGAMGYQGDMSQFQQFIESDPQRKAQMNGYTNAARMMARGGAVQKFAPGGMPQDGSQVNQYGTYKAQVDAQNAAAQKQADQFNKQNQAAVDASNAAFRQAASTTTETTVDPSTQPYTPPTASTITPEQQYTPLPITEETPVLKPVLDAEGNPVLNEDGTPQTEQVLDEQGNPVMQSQLKIGDYTMNRMLDPRLPSQAITQAATVPVGSEQLVATGTGEVGDESPVATSLAAISTANDVTKRSANIAFAERASGAVTSALGSVQASRANPNDPRAKVIAAQQSASSVGDLTAAQGTATLMDNPTQRQIQNGELISGVANAQRAARFTEQIEAAQATPSQQATVQGQLANLTQNFDAANPPSWAAGALRNANAQMAARGLGASSIAGQAIIQATLEAALPIAQADAATTASFEAQNLSNRQQRAMLAAEQRAAFLGQEFDQAFQARVQNASRIADKANVNFTAEQQVALENSRIANTMDLQNLSNNQAIVIAEASALANMDLSNLNNRQQASVLNAQNFLQTDLANASNAQQTTLFKAQQRINSLLTDQAAANANRQFNASSRNQVDQFYDNLIATVNQFNASQKNAAAQFNAGQQNTVERFNAEIANQRDQFNAQNQLAIAQSNAVWRREIATLDTAEVNRVNEINAERVMDMSKQAYDNLWNYYGDTMEWAWTSAENELNRVADMAIATLNADERAAVSREQSKNAAGQAVGSLIATLGAAYISSKAFCWVAREVYGKSDPRWFVFRLWIKYEAPAWFRTMYGKHGESYSKFIRNKPALKWVTKKLMDIVVERKEIRSATC